MLSACHSEETEVPATGEATLSFYVQNYEQISLDKIKTRGTDATSLAHLAMAIYDASTLELAAEPTIQNSGDDEYGQFSVTLPYGNYVFVFLGYDGSRTADMQNPKTIFFADNYVPHLFAKSMELSINSESTEARTVTLSRAVACFSLTCNGDLPSTLAKMSFSAKGGSGQLNALTNFADAAQDRTYTYSNLSSYAGKSSMTINLYTFLPANESSMNFTVTAYDSEDNAIRSRTFANVPMKINQRTCYIGDFFASDSFSLQLDNDEWDEQSFNF